MRRAAAIIALLFAIAAAPAARADDLFTSTPPERPLTPSNPNDFGWQVVAADLAGLGSMIALASFTGSGASVLPYLLAAPTVHAVHGDAGGAVASLMLTAAAPVALGYLGYRLDAARCGPDEDGCGSMGILLGVIIGFGLAVAVDSSFLAHPDPAAPTPPTPRIDMSPSFAFSRDGHVSLGLTGRF